jgi:hypothetical protein
MGVLKRNKMKPYPLGLDNPYVIRGIIGSSRWGLYRREPFEKVAEFASEFQAYDARRAILKQQGYDV